MQPLDKNEIGRISKVILEYINKELQNELQLQQWNDTSAVITWFKKLKAKSNINLWYSIYKTFITQ